jgi:hypothetical protein
MKRNYTKAALFLFIAALGLAVIAFSSCKPEKEPTPHVLSFVSEIYQEEGVLVLVAEKSVKKDEIVIELTADETGLYHFAFEDAEYELAYIVGPLKRVAIIQGEAWEVKKY